MYERESREMAKHVERWQELGIDFDEVAREAEKIAESRELPEVSLEHLELDTQAGDFSQDLLQWLRACPDPAVTASDDLAVLRHFVFMVSAKVHRALIGLADAKSDVFAGEYPRDADGSAKVALLGLERTQAACERLGSGQVLPAEFGGRFMASIQWLITEIDRTLPDARSFIRAGFDEPEAVARLEAIERGDADQPNEKGPTLS